MLTNRERTFKMDSMRLFKKKNGYYYISLRRGHEKSLKTKNKELAQQAFKQLQKKLLLGKVVSIDPEKNITLAQFTKEYLATSGAPKAEPSKRSDKLSLETFAASVGGSRPLKMIGRKHIDDFIGACLNRGLSVATVNTYLRRAKAALNVAVSWKYLKVNPFVEGKVRQLKAEKKTPRFLFGEEIKKLFDAITDPEFKDMVFFYVNTGLRRAELVRLKWGDILKMGDAYTILVRETKTSTERTVEANEEVAKLIERMKRGKDKDYLFPRWRTPDAVTRLFRKYADDSGIPHIRLHDLRHTTASHLVMAGVPLKTVAEILGHARTSTTDIYAHLVKGHVKEAMAKLVNAFNSQEIEKPRLVTTRKNKKK